MVRHRIIVRHGGRWEGAQYVDGVEELIIMSSDDLCFRSLMREIHELLETDPTSVDSEMVVYVVQRGCISSRVIPETVPEYREPVKEEVRDDTQHYEAPEHDFDDDAFPHEEEEVEEIPTTDEEAEENARTGLLESMFIEFIGWIRSTRGPLIWDEPSTSNTDELHKGAIFRTKDDLALAVGLYHMQNRVKYAVYRSNKTRLVYMCKHGRVCPFRLCVVVDGVVWRIYKFNNTHTCHMDMSRTAPRQVPARVIAKHFARKLVDEGVVLKPKEMMSELLREYGIQIDYSFTLRSRTIAIEMIYGDYDKLYAQLSAFLHTLQLRNPETLAFQEGSRPVVMIDGTYLKGRNKGILFVAATKDGNEQILPIAIGLGPIENDDSWKCIKNAVAAVFLRAAHGLCYYHLQNKMAKRGAHVIAMFKEAAYAYHADIFERHMSALELVSTPAYQKLYRIGPEHWSRSQCPVQRFSFMTSNAAESLNARLLWARRLPICSMLEVFKRIVEEWFVERRATTQSWDHVLTPEAVNKLSKNVEHGRCFPIRCTTLAHLWKVEVGRESFMVDLQHRTCDYREFELDLIPCSHAAAAIRFSGGHIYDFVDRCYKTETIVSMYDSVIMGLPSSEEWISPPYGSPIVLAPVIKKQAGRLRMSRARGGVKASSSSRRQVYTRCHGPDHNRPVCTTQIPIGGVDLNAPPEDVPMASAHRRAPKKCNVCGEMTHTRPRCPTRQTTDLD
ncbi:hypothetical protein C2S51_029967 [Perilla frutescens var. frutescens]|nr:hypothetical protein C2S51_029967 [Perilla frutescens var. frutescens]